VLHSVLSLAFQYTRPRIPNVNVHCLFVLYYPYI